ncbi:hypothetical protein C2869_07345 [Saccharobesus litoralis]|uniref:Uncharacterized protein n=1 Tax=Saccharobesus litoralis TaxID=2172099 RepID=A0A2S0VPW9_9ALTE|nr:LamG-like jellyroll fold domain-containing protein [Saccharobesus litoralis]AWB66256.1 hypothetical protein C2869_07345 [Saccharobesus litoralis]
MALFNLTFTDRKFCVKHCSVWLLGLLLLSSLFVSKISVAAGGFDIWNAQHGFVVGRSLILSESGNLIWAEYDENGGVVNRSFAVQEGDLSKGYVLPANEVLALVQVYQQLLQANPGAELIDAKAYQALEYTARNGHKVIKPATNGYRYFLVKPETAILTGLESPFLMGFKFDVESAVGAVSGGDKAVLFDNQHQVALTSPYTVSPLSGFYRGEEDGARLENTSQPYMPISGAGVEIIAPFPGFATTDENGLYQAQYGVLPCPGFDFSYTTPAVTEVWYSAWTPTGRKPLMFPQFHPGYTLCQGSLDNLQYSNTSLTGIMMNVHLQSIIASLPSVLTYPSNFYIDAQLISGELFLANPGSSIELAASTEYKYQTPNFTQRTTSVNDFDQDGIIDIHKQGDNVIQYAGVLVDGEFVCETEADKQTHYGVYLSSNSSGETPACDSDTNLLTPVPDLVRLIDHSADLTHQGLLSTISKEDLQDTDIYVFRSGNGQLLMEQKGLAEYVVSPFNPGTLFGVSENGLTFSSLIRGFDGYAQTLWGSNPYSEYLSHSNINLNIANGSYESLAPGEPIEIIAINRKTGYMGSTRSTLGQFNSGGVGYSENVIVMTPPNLKVKATRKYKTEHNLGESDRPNEHTIAFEGSAANTDTLVTIEVEWLNQDGTPLPPGLADYGFTGRLVKVTDSGMELTEVGHFDITPGKRIENVQIPTDHEYSETFYLQISAKPQHENPTFGDLGASPDGPLQYRPKHYVPFKVPVYDEVLDELQKTQYNALKAAGEQNLTPPETQYQYRYRPEYQFSLLDFELKNFKRQTENDGTVAIGSDDKGYMISSDDVAIDILFSISDYQTDDLEPLPFLGIGQQLVMEVGGKEVELTLGDDQQLTFNNPADLHQLEGEDFLFLQLYDNQDPDNILWEYAFQMLTADTRWAGYDNIGEDGTIYVSADELEVPLQGLIVGYDEDLGPADLKWKTTGAGSGTTQADSQNNTSLGYSSATFTADCTAGSVNTAEIMYGDTKATVGPIETLPGKPDSTIIRVNGTRVTEATTDLKTYLLGHKPIPIEITVKDQCGNLVSDGTSVEISIEGHAVVTVDDPGTIDGKVYATVEGASLPSTDNFLVVKSGTVPQIKVPFVVQPLTVEISDYLISMEDRSIQPITVTVTDDDGDVVVDKEVIFESNGGRFKQGIVTTNSDGIATGYLHTGFHPIDDLKISARVGLTFGDTVTSKVIPQTEGNGYLQTKDAVVVGDETQAGHAEYTRYDGANIALAYDTQANITINGTIGQSHEITLGTLADPNLMPLAVYHLNEAADDADTITEATGTLATSAYNTELSNDHPSAGYSTYFNQQQSSYLSAPLTDKIKPTNGVSFRVDIKPQTQLNAAQQTADIFNMAGGAHKLTLNQDNTLSYTIYNDAGEQTVTSAPINLNQWYQVAGQYHNGQLTLQINGTQYKQATNNSALNYGITSKGLTVGEGYTGYISSLKFFNPNSAPLVTFNNNQTTQTVNLNQTSQDLSIKSTGLLNANNQQLNQLRIGVNHQGQQTYVSVISKSLFTQLSSYQLNTLQPQGYPTVYQRQQYQGIPFIPMAHANIFDFSWDDAFDSLKSVAGFILPFEAIGTFYEQTNYLMDGDSRFDELELALAGIEILTIIPIAKPLLAITKPLKLFIRPLKSSNPKFIKALGDVIGKLGDDIVKGKFDKAINLLPMMLIMGEMLSDAEARQGLMVMVNSITSADDIFAWADYLSLPADGWEGDEVPEVVLNPSYPEDAFYGVPFINKAWAAKTRSRINGVEIGKMFTDINKQFKSKLSDDPTLLTNTLKNIGKPMRRTKVVAMRKLVFNKNMLKSSLSIMGFAGSKNLVNLIKNGTGMRMSPLSFIGVISYLETRMNSEVCKELPNCKYISSIQLQNKIRTKYALALGNYLAGNITSLANQEVGAAFHLAMIAVKHFEYEATGKNAIVGIESTKNIPIYQYTSTKNNSVDVVDEKTRYVDIVLAGKSKEVWVEVKSLEGPFVSDKWRQWRPLRQPKHNANMKQFSLDRIGATFNEFIGANNPLYNKAERIEWWLQSFQNKTKRQGNKINGYRRNDISKLDNILAKFPTSKLLQASFGLKDKSDNTKFAKNVKDGCFINTFSIKNWLKSPSVKNVLLQGFAQELIDEFADDTFEAANIDPEELSLCQIQ